MKSGKPKIGSSVRVSLSRNCLLCQRYRVCRDPAKKASYACSRFREGNELTEDDIKLLLDTAHKPSTEVEQLIAQTNDEESISDMIENVLSSGVPVPPDLKLNDRHIARPKNVYEWMTNPRFVGSEQPPFTRQVQVGLSYLTEYCPRCTDMEFFECLEVDTPLEEIEDRVVMLEYGVCPECKTTKAELILEEELNDYMELAVLAGQRSAKTSSVTLFEAYNTCRWLLTPNLPDTFKILPSTVLTSTYTAVTFNQAKNNFWTPLATIFTSSNWFKEYHRFLTDQGRRYGEELFTINETMVRYRHKNLFLSPAAPSKRTMRGSTRIGAAIDELSWFPSGKTKGGKDFERLDAKEVYTALKRSMATMRAAYRRRLKQGYSNLPKPLFSNISSPSSKNDALMSLYRQAIGSREIYTGKWATWEFNPLLSKDDFAEEFRLNPVEAERDYACNPPLGLNSWIPKLENVTDCFSKKRLNGVSVLSTRAKTKNRKTIMSSSYKQIRSLKAEYQGILALDAGYSNNSFAFALCYPINIPDRLGTSDDADMDYSVRVHVYAVGEVIPKEDTPISFNKIYKNVLLPLCMTYNVRYVVSDRWQNIKLLQDLEDATGVEYLEHRLSSPDFVNVREALYDGQIEFPKLEMDTAKIVETVLDDYPHIFYLKPVSHLYYQLGTVQDTGSSVVKGEGATDDILRSVILGYTVLQMPDILEGISETEDTVDSRMALGAIPSMRGRSATTEVKGVGVVASSMRSSNRSTGGSMGITGGNTQGRSRG